MKQLPVLPLLLLFLCSILVPRTGAEIDDKGNFTYSGGSPDDTLAQIALFLMEKNLKEGSTFVSDDIDVGIVGYQLRYFDNGNRLIDEGDWFSIRRYRIPDNPDSLRIKDEPNYWKKDFMEFVDIDMNGMDNKDYYFLDSRRINLHNVAEEMLSQYQIQIERAVSVFIKNVDFQSILDDLGATGQTAVKKKEAFDDGSLPSNIVLGLDLKYVFRPMISNGRQLSERESVERVRSRLGLIYSATTSYTDLGGYRLQDMNDQLALLQRTYDPIEQQILTLIVDALFDIDADGIITPENITNGYTRFRELHQQLVENARSQNRRLLLPSEKLARLRQEYQSVHNKEFDTGAGF
ncbi:MAG: hypothetical protein O7G87_02765 [bacterium]|nr:hypothetical protein [bacterium]